MDPDEGSDAIPDRDNEISSRESLRRWPLTMQQAKTRKPQRAPKAASGLSDAAVVGLLGDRYQDIEPVADRCGIFTGEDSRGESPKERPLKPSGIHATIYHVLGVGGT